VDESADPAPKPVRRGPDLTATLEWAKRRWGLLVAVMLPAITVATVVIPLAADAGTRLTSADTLIVSGTDSTAAPASSGAQADLASALSSRELLGESIGENFPNVFWRVAANAPWETFPVEPTATGSCSANQLVWLAKYGRRDIADIWNGYLTLKNTATDGSSMSVRNIRSVGTFIAPASPEVAVQCNLGIGGASEIIPLKQDLGTDAPAVFAEDYGDLPAGTPGTLNLAPGQYLQVVMFFNHDGANHTSDFSGSLVADVVVGDKTTKQVLFDGFTREGAPAISATSLTIYGDQFTCVGAVTPCTLDEFIAKLKADPAYVN